MNKPNPYVDMMLVHARSSDELHEEVAAEARARHTAIETAVNWIEDHPSAGARSTPFGYDPRWIEAINGALKDRDSTVRAVDVDDVTWNTYIGPLCDAYEDRTVDAALWKEL